MNLRKLLLPFYLQLLGVDVGERDVGDESADAAVPMLFAAVGGRCRGAYHIRSSITALSPRVFLLPSPILGSQPFVVPKNTSSPPTALVGLSMSLVVFLKVMRWLVLA